MSRVSKQAGACQLGMPRGCPPPAWCRAPGQLLYPRERPSHAPGASNEEGPWLQLIGVVSARWACTRRLGSCLPFPRLQVTFTNKDFGMDVEEEFDTVMLAVGREACTKTMCLEKVRIATHTNRPTAAPDQLERCPCCSL